MKSFIWKRVHSLMGLWLVLFLIEHLVTNSQAALWLGSSGQGFVRMVDALHNLPYLQVVEVILLGVPILLHMGLGIQYVLHVKYNTRRTDGSSPSLPHLQKNQAYTWHRICSWVLVVGLIWHVIAFRFIQYPMSVDQGTHTAYFVKLTKDANLVATSHKIGVKLYDEAAVRQEVQKLKQKARTITGSQTLLQAREDYQRQEKWVHGLRSIAIQSREVIGESSNFGSVVLLTVRETFRNPIYCVLYSVFVLAACFHGFHGLWTFLLSWGIVIRHVMQQKIWKICVVFMGTVAVLGLMAIWGS